MSERHFAGLANGFCPEPAAENQSGWVAAVLAGSKAAAEIFEPDTHVVSSLRTFSDGGSTPPASTILQVQIYVDLAAPS